MAEGAFRESLKGLLAKEFGHRVEKRVAFDKTGSVYGYTGEVVLIEVSSHLKASDVNAFRRKAELYAEKTVGKPTG